MDGPPGVACMDTRHPRRLLAPEQVLMRFSIIYDRPSASGGVKLGTGPIRMDVRDRGYELPRIPILRTLVNKGIRKGRGSYAPAHCRSYAFSKSPQPQIMMQTGSWAVVKEKVNSLANGVPLASLTAFLSPSPRPSTHTVYSVLASSGSVGFSTALTGVISST